MKKTIILITTILLLVIPFLSGHSVHAEPNDDLLKELQDLSAELKRIQQELETVNNLIIEEEATQSNLSNSISYLTNQIISTELTIQEKEGQIEKNEMEIQVLGVQIDDAKGQISNLQSAIKHLEEVVTKRTQTSYKNSKISLVEIIAASTDLSSFVKKIKYFSAIREHDLNLMEDLTENKTDLSQHKTTLSEKKTAVEELKAQIEIEKIELEKATERLAWQRELQNELFSESKTRETENRNIYSQLDQEQKDKMEELNQLQAALAQATVSGTEVKQGWAIGLQGATGYVFTWVPDIGWTEGDGICDGYHSHFMTWERNPETGNWYHVNPAKYILSGKLRRPFDSYVISQYYGSTDNGLYTSSFHNGIDYVPSGGCGTPVLAAGDGTIQFGYDYFEPGIGPNDPYGSYYAWIYHGEIDGIEVKTGYWHLKYP